MIRPASTSDGMTPPDVRFAEARADRKVHHLPLAHVSIELGHLYFEDLEAGPERVSDHFRAVAPWVAAAREIHAAALADRRARISTCVLVDDYFGPTLLPADVVPRLLGAAAQAGLTVDYLVRESACAEADGISLARLVEARIVADPPPESNGTRPPVTEAGWLCNGQRSPAGQVTAAMEAVLPWAPPTENAANRHSVFVDVELWDQRDGRTWSCAFLAAVWQLLRLGLLRYDGAPVAVPQPWPGELPSDWRRLPAVIQLNDAAEAFSAYRTLSVLGSRFLPTEHAVRTILSQVAVDSEVGGQVAARWRGEGLNLPAEAVDRIGYLFIG